MGLLWVGSPLSKILFVTLTLGNCFLHPLFASYTLSEYANGYLYPTTYYGICFLEPIFRIRILQQLYLPSLHILRNAKTETTYLSLTITLFFTAVTTTIIRKCPHHLTAT